MRASPILTLLLTHPSPRQAVAQPLQSSPARIDDVAVQALSCAMNEFITGRVAGPVLSSAHALALASALVPPLLSAVDDAPRGVALEQLLGVVAAVAASPVPGKEAVAGAEEGDDDEAGSPADAADLLAATQAQAVGASGDGCRKTGVHAC